MRKGKVQKPALHSQGDDINFGNARAYRQGVGLGKNECDRV